jgi:hypothetical protein
MQQEINDCNFVIALLDAEGNFRDLNARESVLRISLIAHLARLVKEQLDYWKQRGKVKWVTLGESNSKIFHSIATTQKKRNHIASLTISSHESKARLLLEFYKNMLGKSKHASFFLCGWATSWIC